MSFVVLTLMSVSVLRRYDSTGHHLLRKVSDEAVPQDTCPHARPAGSPQGRVGEGGALAEPAPAQLST
jgi:hypothetical protein